MFEREYCCRTLSPPVRCSWRQKGIMIHENISCLHARRRNLFVGIVTSHAILNPLLKLKKISITHWNQIGNFWASGILSASYSYYSYSTCFC